MMRKQKEISRGKAERTLGRENIITAGEQIVKSHGRDEKNGGRGHTGKLRESWAWRISSLQRNGL